jgi:hypothetical protein
MLVGIQKVLHVTPGPRAANDFRADDDDVAIDLAHLDLDGIEALRVCRAVLGLDVVLIFVEY